MTLIDYIKNIRQKVGQEAIILNFAGICVENNQGEILLQKRADSNQWGFPGGALELGESVETCAKREVFEETGLLVNVLSLIGVYSNYFSEYPNGDKAQNVLHFFKGTVSGGKLLTKPNEETIQLAFFDPKKCPPLFNQQHQDCLADVINGKSGVFR